MIMKEMTGLTDIEKCMSHDELSEMFRIKWYNRFKEASVLGYPKKGIGVQLRFI